MGGIVCHVYHKFTELSSSLSTSNIDSDPQVVTFDKGHSTSDQVTRSGQRIPLLDFNNSDSEDDSQTENPNASEVLFDILKRRDSRR